MIIPSAKVVRTIPFGANIPGLFAALFWLVSSFECAAGLPPVIIVQPTDLSTVLSSNAVFTVQATGSLPITFQWQVNSTNIPAATDASLTLANVQLADQGSYAVILSNAFGVAIRQWK